MKVSIASHLSSVTHKHLDSVKRLQAATSWKTWQPRFSWLENQVDIMIKTKKSVDEIWVL